MNRQQMSKTLADEVIQQTEYADRVEEHEVNDAGEHVYMLDDGSSVTVNMDGDDIIVHHDLIEDVLPVDVGSVECGPKLGYVAADDEGDDDDWMPNSTREDSDYSVELLYEARSHLVSAIDLIRDAVNGTNQEDYAEAYILPHLKSWVSQEHCSIENLIEQLPK